MVLIAPVAAPEGLIFTTNNVQLKVGEKIMGKGTVYLSQNALAWQPEHIPEGISIPWKQVSVHGVSTTPSKCIYFMLDHKLIWYGVYEPNVARAANVNQNGGGGEAAEVAAAGNDGDEDEGNETDEEDAEEEQMTECWLIPEDVNTVDTMFHAMTDCQALHPDSAESVSEESDFMDDDGAEDDGGLGREGNGGADAEAAQGGMQNLNLNDRFADAEE